MRRCICFHKIEEMEMFDYAFISYIQPIRIVILVNIYIFMLIIMPYILLSHTLILILLMFRTIYIAICTHLRIRGVWFSKHVRHVF